MNHRDIRHKLSDYLDASVTADEKAAIEEHLASCPDCRNALEELRKTLGHLKELEEVSPPAWMTQKIMARVRAGQEKKSWITRLFYPLRVKLPLEALGMVFLAITVYFIYQHEPSRPASTGSPAEAPAPMKEFREPALEQKDRGAARQAPTLSGKAVPQKPGYEALDMKQAYEAPPAPTPAPQADAPTEEPARQESKRRKAMSIAPPAATSTGNEAETAKSEARSEAPASKSSAMSAARSSDLADHPAKGEVSEKPVLVLITSDKDLDLGGVVKVIEASGGSVLEKKAGKLSVKISSARFPDLAKKLQSWGRVEQKNAPAPGMDTIVEVEVRLETQGE